MLQRLTPCTLIRIAERTIFVDLILKYVRIDGAWTHAVTVRELADLCRAAESIRKVPQNVKSDSGADAG